MMDPYECVGSPEEVSPTGALAWDLNELRYIMSTLVNATRLLGDAWMEDPASISNVDLIPIMQTAEFVEGRLVIARENALSLCS